MDSREAAAVLLLFFLQPGRHLKHGLSRFLIYLKVLGCFSPTAAAYLGLAYLEVAQLLTADFVTFQSVTFREIGLLMSRLARRYQDM